MSVRGTHLAEPQVKNDGGGANPSASLSQSSRPPHGRSSSRPNTVDQRARRSAALTGSSQRDIGDRVASASWHVNGLFVLCVRALQSGHVGVGCVSGEILCRYCINSGHLFALGCARVLVYLDSVFLYFYFWWDVIYYFVICPCLKVTLYYRCVYELYIVFHCL